MPQASRRIGRRVAFDASFPLGDFRGETREVEGEFHADPADLRRGVTGVLRVNAATISTGVAARDRDMLKALDVSRHQEIRFAVERVEATFGSVADRADVLLTIAGRMWIHGTERSMTFPGRVRRRDDGLWVRGESPLRMSDFGVGPPRRFFFRVADIVLASFELVLVPGPGGPPGTPRRGGH